MINKNIENMIHSLNTGTINALFDVVKKDYLHDNQSSEYNIIRFLETVDDEDMVDIFKKVSIYPYVEININFYDLIDFFPPKLTYFLYEYNKNSEKDTFPLSVFSHSLNDKKSDNFKLIFDEFKKRKFFDFNNEESYINRALKKGRNVYLLFKIEKNLKINIDKFFIAQEENLSTPKELSDYIDDFESLNRLKSHTVNEKNVLERIVKNNKAVLVNTELLELLLDTNQIDILEMKECHISFFRQVPTDVLKPFMYRDEVKNMIKNIVSLDEKEKINKELFINDKKESIKKRI